METRMKKNRQGILKSKLSEEIIIEATEEPKREEADGNRKKKNFIIFR